MSSVHCAIVTEINMTIKTQIYQGTLCTQHCTGGFTSIIFFYTLRLAANQGAGLWTQHAPKELVTLGKTLDLFEPWCLHLKNRDYSICLS